MDNQFINRLKSFCWRMGGATILFILGWLIDNIGKLEIPEVWLGVASLLLGYVSGEFTKWWAIHQAQFGKTFFGRIKE